MRSKDQKQVIAQLKKNYPVMEKFISECEKETFTLFKMANRC